jgi:hypothetical protein
MLRLCVDYRLMNLLKKQDPYNLPIMAAIHHRLINLLVTIDLELKNAFYLLQVWEGNE